VKNWENYYQSIPAPLPGQSVSGADLNLNLTGQATHGSVPAHPSVARSLTKRILMLSAHSAPAPAPKKAPVVAPKKAPVAAAAPAPRKAPVVKFTPVKKAPVATR
jgi:hypothetical protein